ncbi:uncharacterized protein LOC123720371 [Pieris brassicae]|uniref:uncharacterized protein LOC123720371 n=1 Tax=Pieris brassicae TaxID=7116 RepID=UPI001E6611C6|nr:uncharacterized protein LOC123720371 [Pieris brassicae]
MCTGTHLHSTLPPPSECSGIDDILRMLDRDPGFSAASSPRTAFESDLIFLAQSAACSFASRGMLRAMARYAKSREETLRNSGMLESPLTEAEQRELALVRDECRFPARTPATPVRRPFSAVDPGSEGESAAKRPCAPSYAPGLPGEPRLAPGRRLDMGPSVLPPSETDPPSDTSPPSVTAPPPAAPLAGRAASAIAPSGATDATSFGPDDPVAPVGDGAPPRMPVAPSYAVMVAAPTVHAQPPRAPEAPKKPAYPPIVIECLPNYVHHLGRIRQILGRPANTRAYGKGYRISPESADEYRVIQRYLSDLEKEDRRVSWFSYSIPAEKDLKVAIRGIPVTTDPEELAQALRALGYEPDYIRPIRARKGRPGCIFLAVLRRTPDITPAIYGITELLYMTGVTIEAWRGKQGPAQCHRCQSFRHSSVNCHRRMACVRCAGEHRAADCTRPRDVPATCANTRLARSVGRRNKTGVQAHLPEPRRLALCAGASSNKTLFRRRLWPRRLRSRPRRPASLLKATRTFLPLCDVARDVVAVNVALHPRWPLRKQAALPQFTLSPPTSPPAPPEPLIPVKPLRPLMLHNRLHQRLNVPPPHHHHPARHRLRAHAPGPVRVGLKWRRRCLRSPTFSRPCKPGKIQPRSSGERHRPSKAQPEVAVADNGGPTAPTLERAWPRW